MPFGFGANASESFSQSLSTSQASGRSFVDPSQAGFLDFTRNLAQNLAGQQFGQTGGLFGTAAALGQQGQQFLGSLGQSIGGLQGMGGPAVQQQQIGQLGQDIGAFFNQQVLPGIGRGAIGAGGLGGGRQGVAQGVAAGEALRAFTGGATDIMANAQQQRLSGLLGASQGALGGVSSLGGLFSLAQAPFAAQFSPLLSLASIVGSPTVLSERQAQARAETTSRTETGGFNVGFGG